MTTQEALGKLQLACSPNEVCDGCVLIKRCRHKEAYAVLRSAVEERDAPALLWNAYKATAEEWKSLCLINQDLVKQAIKNIDALKAEVSEERDERVLSGRRLQTACEQLVEKEQRIIALKAEVERLKAEAKVADRLLGIADRLIDGKEAKEKK